MKLPEWMNDEFEKGECPYCKKPLMDKGVETHGIKEEKSKTKKKTQYVHFYDYKCPKCKKQSIFSSPTTFKEFVKDMLELADLEMPEVLQDNEDDTDEEPQKKSGISDDEINSFKKTINASENLKDFFEKIGIPLDNPNPEKTDENK